MNAALRLIFFLVSVSFAASLFGGIEEANPKRFAELIEEKDTILIDVRTPPEAKTAHIKDSKLINYYSESFHEQIQKLPKEKKLLLYCRSGNRSGKTAILLEKWGYEQLVNLSGGINAWKQAKLPIVEM